MDHCPFLSFSELYRSLSEFSTKINASVARQKQHNQRERQLLLFLGHPLIHLTKIEHIPRQAVPENLNFYRSCLSN